MCLVYDREITREVRKAIKNGQRTFYKVVKVHKNKVRTPYQSNLIKAGEFVSDRTSKRIGRSGDYTDSWSTEYEINKGIHVFVTKVHAGYSLETENSCFNKTVISVTIDPDDFVCAGTFQNSYDSAVFMKVTYTDYQLRKARKAY